MTADGLADAAAAMDAAIAHHGAAKCALDIALHDLAAKAAGLPLHRFLGLSADVPPTDFTIGIDRPEIVAERAVRAAHFPALKIKLGGPADLQTLEAVRAVYSGPIRVDANTGWAPDAALALLPDLERLGVELIEQPFPAHRLDQLRWLQDRSALPIVADESAVAIDALEGLVGVVAGVNVKLAKCGGVGPAMRMLSRASELGLPDVPGLHGGDFGRHCRVGSCGVPRGLGRPRRQPASRRRSVRGPGTRAGLSMAARRGPGSRGQPAGGGTVSLSTGSGTIRTGVHRTSVRVDNLVDELVDKPSSGAGAAGLRWHLGRRALPGEGRSHPDRTSSVDAPAGQSIPPTFGTISSCHETGGHAIDGSWNSTRACVIVRSHSG